MVEQNLALYIFYLVTILTSLAFIIFILRRNNPTLVEPVESSPKNQTGALIEEKARLEASINSLSIGYLMVNRELQVTAINGAARRIFGFRPELGGVHPIEIPLEEHEPNLLHQIILKFSSVISLRQLLEKSINESLIDVKDVTLNDRDLRIFINPIVLNNPDGHKQTIGAVVLIEDITEARLLDRSKDEFLSIASHELRTPLTAIKGYSFLIQKYYLKDMQDPKLKEMLSRIEQSSDRLIAIVNDFLDTSRLEQSRVELRNEMINVNNIIQTVVEEYQAVALSKHIRLEFAKQNTNLPLVYGDTNRITQILVNLVGNAMKFTDRGGVEVSTSTEETGYVKISVRDTGRGIPEENHKLLFRKFQQAGKQLYARDSTGTGLGLYISKMLTERMGGQIRLESSEMNVGSTFSFTLPIATT